jgi:hypothetical protein
MTTPLVRWAGEALRKKVESNGDRAVKTALWEMKGEI